MATKQCDVCGELFDDTVVEFCPGCGEPVAGGDAPGTDRAYAVTAATH